MIFSGSTIYDPVTPIMYREYIPESKPADYVESNMGTAVNIFASIMRLLELQFSEILFLEDPLKSAVFLAIK